ncbi:citrate synthase [Occultella glacieicola]|nr:citrate/2-methylcitrate synthase [Occultella glacieicola]
MNDLLTATQAAARLGVKRETIYAYVSRGALPRQRDGRISYFRPEDVDRLLQEGRRPSLNEFGKTSRLSTLKDDMLHYRARPVSELVEQPFESVAHFLWTGRWEESVGWVANAESVAVARRVGTSLPQETISSDRLRVMLAAVTAADPFRSDSSIQSAAHAAGPLLRTLVEAMPQRSEPIDVDLASMLWSRLSTITPNEEQVRVLNAALVLLADHGLSPSTYAAQIAASAHADLYGVLAAGLGVGSSAVLGASATAVEAMLSTFGDTHGTMFVLSARLRDEGRLPGFGHPQHPQGDARASHLLKLLKPLATEDARLQRSFEMLALLKSRRLPPPNVYLALGMIADSSSMEHGASEVMFGIARSAGWIAHAIDEYEMGTISRLREPHRAVERGWPQTQD